MTMRKIPAPMPILMSFPLSAASYQVFVHRFSDIARRGTGAVPWSVCGLAVNQAAGASRRCRTLRFHLRRHAGRVGSRHHVGTRHRRVVDYDVPPLNQLLVPQCGWELER